MAEGGIEPEDVLDSRYSWFRMGISFLLGAIGIAGIWAVAVVMPEVQAEFGLDRSGATLSYIVTMVGFAIGNVLIGRFVDRYGIVLPLQFAGCALGAGLVAASFAQDFRFFLALQFLVGLGASTSFSPMMADISHWFLKRRGIAVAIAATGSYIGGALWPLIVGVLTAAADWRLAYLVLGIVSFVTLIPLSLLLRRRPPALAAASAPQAPSGATRSIALSPAGLQWLLVAAGITCSAAMAMPHSQLVAMSSDLGFSIAEGAAMMSLVFVGGAVSRLVFGLLADRLGGLATVLLGSALMAASLFLYLPFDTLWVLYMASLAFGLAHGGIIPSLVVIVREYLPAREAGRRVGVVITSTVAGVTIGSWLFGWLRDFTGSYQAAFLTSIGANLVTIAVLILLRWRERPDIAAR